MANACRPTLLYSTIILLTVCNQVVSMAATGKEGILDACGIVPYTVYTTGGGKGRGLNLMM